MQLQTAIVHHDQQPSSVMAQRQHGLAEHQIEALAADTRSTPLESALNVIFLDLGGDTPIA
jgi:hypothetical protein